MADFPSSPVTERLRQFAAYGDTAEGRILAQLALTEIERLSGAAQPQQSSPDSAIVDAAKRMQAFNALTQLVTIPWDDIDPQERNHWIGLACAALRFDFAQTGQQQIKDAFYAGYWAWFGPASQKELDRGCSELDKSWLEYEAALSLPSPLLGSTK